MPRRLCLRGASWALHIPAAILGMHTLMSNQQYYQALGSSSIVNKEGLNSEYRPPPPPGPGDGALGVMGPPASGPLHPLMLSGSLQKLRFQVAKSIHLCPLLSWNL